MPKQKNPNYLPPIWVTFIIPNEYTILLKWYLYHKGNGANMSALLRDTLLKGIAESEKEKVPQWFLDWFNNSIQPSISEQQVDLRGLFDD